MKKNEKSVSPKGGAIVSLKGVFKAYRFIVCAAALALVCTGVFAGRADAVRMWNVTSRGDDPQNSSTLRYVLLHADAGDTIRISVDAVLLTDQLVIDRNVTIAGPATIRQSATHKRVLYVSSTCTMNDITVAGGNFRSPEYFQEGLKGAGIYIATSGNLTMNRCVVTENTVGGAIENVGALTMTGCRIAGNTTFWPMGSALTIVYNSFAPPVAALTDCVVENNTAQASLGAAINNNSTLTMSGSAVRNNTTGYSGGQSFTGGGLYLGSRSVTTLSNYSSVTGNTPEQVYQSTTPYSSPVFTYDSTCTIGTAPNNKATAFAGYTGETPPEPRSIADEADAKDVARDLTNPESALFRAVANALAADLGGTAPASAGSYSGVSSIGASLYYANAFENIAVEDDALSIEFTASWPDNVRYYALFSRADGSGYEIPARGVQFEVKAGQPLPEDVTPPDFYEDGEGLMTWRNIVADNGPYDHNPAEGAVTFRVCSIRAVAVQRQEGGGGGCSVGGGVSAWAALLFLAPVIACALKK